MSERRTVVLSAEKARDDCNPTRAASMSPSLTVPATVTAFAWWGGVLGGVVPLGEASVDDGGVEPLGAAPGE